MNDEKLKDKYNLVMDSLKFRHAIEQMKIDSLEGITIKNMVTYENAEKSLKKLIQSKRRMYLGLSIFFPLAIIFIITDFNKCF